MSQAHQTPKAGPSATDDGRSENLRDSPMMAHLLDALQDGTDIGHYGRLTFVMIARHFLDEDEMVKLLSKQPDHSAPIRPANAANASSFAQAGRKENETEARALIQQVKAHDYNPPKRERILQWQSRQDFPICPTPDEPGTCNVYAELRFPPDIYENINEFWEERAEAEENTN